jgi:hypothetical protein
MKTTILKTFVVGLALAGLVVALPVKADSTYYTGTISPGTLGGSVTTSLPMFNIALGTLTSVQIQLNFTITPYAQIYNFSGVPRTFTSSDWISFSYAPIDIWTVSHGSDSWTLAAPTVTTGTIYGTGQVLPNATGLQLVGSTSAPANLTASGVNLAGYIGAGNLVFGTAGVGQVLSGGAFFSGGGFSGGGGNLIGTASVTYDYTPVPEPSTFALMLGGLILLPATRRALRRNRFTKP